MSIVASSRSRSSGGRYASSSLKVGPERAVALALSAVGPEGMQPALELLPPRRQRLPCNRDIRITFPRPAAQVRVASEQRGVECTGGECVVHVLRHEAAFARLDADHGLHRYVREVCAEAGFQPRSAVQTRQVDTAVQLAAAGLAAGLGLITALTICVFSVGLLREGLCKFNNSKPFRWHCKFLNMEFKWNTT